MNSGTLRIIALTLFVAIVLAVVVALVVVQTGAYDVAATRPHHALTAKVLVSLTDNSVRHRAADVPLDPAYDEPDLAEGFEHYHAMCVGCHGAPGVDKSKVGQGLYPPAPDLSDSAADLSPQEVFWILEHGIKMTGMPAFGPTHDDEHLWDITAFVKGLPDMTPDEYRDLEAAADGDGSEHDDD